VTSKLGPLVNSGDRNNLVLQSYLQYCTQPDGGASSSSSSGSGSSSSKKGGEQEQQESLMSMQGTRAVRKAIGFAVDIAHAEALNDMFTAAGASCVSA
jgi:hypothetical protein